LCAIHKRPIADIASHGIYRIAHLHFFAERQSARTVRDSEAAEKQQESLGTVAVSRLVRCSSFSDSELLDFLSRDIEFTIKRVEGNFGWATFIIFSDGMEVGDLDTRKLVSTTIIAYDQLHRK
jgi:hypothetical protein